MLNLRAEEQKTAKIRLICDVCVLLTGGFDTFFFSPLKENHSVPFDSDYKGG